MTNPRNISPLAAAILVLLHSLPEQDRNDVGFGITEGFDVSGPLSNIDTISPAAVDRQQNAPTNHVAVTGHADALPTSTQGQRFATNIDVDADQVPWDERIHASTKNKNADGKWKRKRNVDDATYNTITASLKGVAAAPTNTGLPPPPPAAASAPSLPPPPAAPQAPEYTDLVTLLTQHTHSPDNPTGRITADWISTTLKHYGVPSGLLPDAAANPALCGQIAAGVRQVLGVTA
jgi:hypothetical protein